MDAAAILSIVARDPSSLNLRTTYHRDKYSNVTKVTDPKSYDTLYDRNLLGYVTKVASAG